MGQRLILGAVSLGAALDASVTDRRQTCGERGRCQNGPMTWESLPPRPGPGATPRMQLAELAAAVGEVEAALACAALLAANDPAEQPELLLYLGGSAGQSVLDSGSWKPYWARVWGARGLLYVWADSVAPDVVAGLGDEHWRVAEMCVKVATRREIGAAGDGAARLAGHELPRVRAAAVRALGRVGDTEHVAVVEAVVDDEAAEVRRSGVRALRQLAQRLDLELDRPDVY